MPVSDAVVSLAERTANWAKRFGYSFAIREYRAPCFRCRHSDGVCRPVSLPVGGSPMTCSICSYIFGLYVFSEHFIYVVKGWVFTRIGTLSSGLWLVIITIIIVLRVVLMYICVCVCVRTSGGFYSYIGLVFVSFGTLSGGNVYTASQSCVCCALWSFNGFIMSEWVYVVYLGGQYTVRESLGRFNRHFTLLGRKCGIFNMGSKWEVMLGCL